LQNDLLSDCKSNHTEFWKTIGRVGVTEHGVSNDVNTVLEKWKNDFSKLFNSPNTTNTGNFVPSGNHMNDNTEILNDNISILEVFNAVKQAKNGKAWGCDNIPMEILKNDCSVSFLHILYNICFSKGIIPSAWNKIIISPIPKSSTADPRDPLSYRGLSLSCTMYKIYCTILNNRLSKWAESNNILSDEQNGFRKGRSTIDHVSSLTNIVETRKKQKLSTFCAFIDFRKAYDFIDRSLLWNKLDSKGIHGNM
jgi:hypothetical protein